MRSDTITMEQEIRDLEAELAAVRAERDFARGEAHAYRHERDTLRVAAQIVLDRWNSRPLTLGMLRGPMEDLEQAMEATQ